MKRTRSDSGGGRRTPGGAALFALAALFAACSLSDGTRGGDRAGDGSAQSDGGSRADGSGPVDGEAPGGRSDPGDGGAVVRDGSTPGIPAQGADAGAGGPGGPGVPGAPGVGPDGAPARCCTADADCGAGFVCAAGRCFEGPLPCTRDADCARLGELACRDGRCAPLVCSCVADAECPTEFVCVDTPRQCGACVPLTSTCLDRCPASQVLDVAGPHARLELVGLPDPEAARRTRRAGVVSAVRDDTLEVTEADGATFTLAYRVPGAAARLVAPGVAVVLDRERTATQTRALLRTADGGLLLALGSGAPARLAPPLDWDVSGQYTGCGAHYELDACRRAHAAVLVSTPGPVFLFPGERAPVAGPAGAAALLVPTLISVIHPMCEPGQPPSFDLRYHFLPP